VIFSIENYIDVVLIGPGDNIRVDIYGPSNSIVDTAILWYSHMRYNFWSEYELIINRNDVILYIDGRFEDT